MNELKRLFANLTWKQRISLAVAVVAVIAGLMSLSHWNHERDFKTLYTGLSQEDAGAVIAKLKETGVEYRLDDTGATIMVPSTRVAELRLQLAAAGVPKTGRIGYELFDKTNLGATDFAEQINYRRALEGELERSIMSMSEVEQARVHVTFAKDSLFLEQRQPSKASVLVKLRTGARMSAQNVAAICQLVGSAVDGLAPEAVTVVDMRGNLLSRARHSGGPDDTDASDALLDYRQKLEHDLVSKINTTLEPLLGDGKFRAGASVECDYSSGEQSEETYDPAKSVMTQSQRTEDMASGTAASGIPGAASNLPRPTSRPATGSGGVTRRSETVSYQSSRVVKHVKLPQGAVKRMSVSVLVDNNVRWEGTGAKAKRILEPPSPEKLKSIRDLVAAAIGFSQERGDQLVVESLPFDATLHEEQVTAAPAQPTARPSNIPPWLETLLNNKPLAIGAAAGVLLLIAVPIVLLSRRSRKKPGVHMSAQLGAAERTALPAASEMNAQLEAQIAENAAIIEQQHKEAMNRLKLSSVQTKKAEVLVKHIAEEAKKDSSTMAQVLRTGINDTEARA